jgi:hypothetical protein
MKTNTRIDAILAGFSLIGCPAEEGKGTDRRRKNG